MVVNKISTAQDPYINECNLFNTMLIEDPVGCNNNPWYLVFEDNFNGTSLDLTKWKIPYQGVLRDFNHKDEKQWYTNSGSTPNIPISNNIEVNNGTLKLIARRETPPITGTWVTDWGISPPATKTSSFEYSSAEIDSKYKFGYGKYVIRCKIPKGKGFWPAFWIYGGDHHDEIDVFEFWNEHNCALLGGEYKPERLSKNPHFNMHHDYNQDNDVEVCPSDLHGCFGVGIDNATDFSEGFHTFTMIWDYYKIEWYIDGLLIRRSSKFYTQSGGELGCNSVSAMSALQKQKAYPTQEYQNIIANLAIQSSGDNNSLTDNTTPFPSQMEIDYIKYYKRISCENNIIINHTSELNLVNGAYNFLSGNTITLGSNVTIPANQYLEVVSTNEINLLPGFSEDIGSGFSAHINPNLPCSANKMIQDNDTLNEYETLRNETKNFHNTQNLLIKIYPNPANESLTIEFNDRMVNGYKIILSDLFGADLLQMNGYADKTLLDVSTLSQGVYFLSIYDNQTENLLHYTKVILE